MKDIKNKFLKKIKFIDLFAGIGGFRIAMESFGAKCVFSSEWDSFAQDTYNINFGEYPKGDITKINEADIPSHDVLCAGFPCQPFSISGKQQGFSDSRGTLFFDIARIVKAKRPKIVFMENVKNFETHDKGRTLAIVKSTMEELGYNFFYKVLNAKDYGIPQKRERIYMVCFRNDLDVTEFKFPLPISLTKHVIDFLQNDSEIDLSLYKTKENMRIDKNIDYSNLSKCIRVGVVNNGGQGDRIYSPLGVGITLSANGGGFYAKTGGYLLEKGPRKLTIRECARLMGFPDTFIPCKNISQAYKQFGNSVVIDVLQFIICEFSKYL